MTYAQMMDLPFAYSSNGDAFYEHDFLTGQEQQIALDKFPTQDELVARYYGCDLILEGRVINGSQ